MMGILFITILLLSFNQSKIDEYVSNIESNLELKSDEKPIDIQSCKGATLIEFKNKDEVVKYNLFIENSYNNDDIKYYFKQNQLVLIEYISYNFKYDDDANIFKDSSFISIRKKYYLENNNVIDSTNTSFSHKRITSTPERYAQDLLSLSQIFSK